MGRSLRYVSADVDRPEACGYKTLRNRSMISPLTLPRLGFFFRLADDRRDRLKVFAAVEINQSDAIVFRPVSRISLTRVRTI
jgi:hypothetical protein